MPISADVLKGDKLALSRLLSAIENEELQGKQAMDELFLHTGKAHIIGITGPSGSGKSTLVNRLALELSGKDGDGHQKKIAILAVDPSSPFSGGALLGDRVRMRDLADKPEIFIRSMATRGALGGLAKASAEAVLALDAAGYPVILVETVGAGQSEVEIARLAHTTVVVDAPGLGDDIQAAKAGILEIADILVVNKADKPAAAGTAQALASMLEMGEELKQGLHGSTNPTWHVPVIQAIATDGNGIPELAAAIRQHQGFLAESGEWDKRNRLRMKELLDHILKDALFTRWSEQLSEKAYQDGLESLCQRKRSPNQVLNQLMG